MAQLPHDIACASPAIQAKYLELRKRGNSEMLAEMLALRSAPASKTDREFLAGRGMLDKQVGDPAQLQAILAAAKAQGFTPGPGDVYDPGLARRMGDPEAFIPNGDGRSYVKKLCEKRGWGAHGMVEVKHRPPDQEPENVRLAPDLIEERLRHMVAENPDVLRRNRAEVEAEIVEKHGMPAKGIPVGDRPNIDRSKAVPMRKRRPKKTITI